ncbi:MarR family transcriptional regulator [Brachybacterium sp. ACRRE]|uniref:MarR family winged helix-turn-helix transcriptional regulator n=1 Tax=Brachybacterium sp. ACRRE TaxID=2918184 RepID=UPI001EF262D0|nr:MarR family transcriptional regulator [Brachybacterium sp. ACRRE]
MTDGAGPGPERSTREPAAPRRSNPKPGSADDLRDAIRVLRIELGILNDKVAARAGLNPRDLDLLDVIDREGPCTPGHLVERTGVRRATLTGILARLEAAGWILRERDAADGRSARVGSSARFDELRELYREADAQVERVVDGLDPALRRALPEVLRALAGGD